jgi:uncharacterized protein DUF4440
MNLTSEARRAGLIAVVVATTANLAPGQTRDASSQTNQPASCPSSRDALVAVVHDFWAAYNKHDASLLDRVLDDQALLIPSDGTPSTKAQFIGSLRQPIPSIESTSSERMDDVRTIVAGNTAVVNFKRQWAVGFKQVGVTVRAVSRMTETLICRNGQWRVFVFQETVLPNATRAPNGAAAGHYGDYVGRYRFGANGDGAEITVTRKGNQIFEAWGKDQPTELLPGKHDTFFARGFGWVERFLRDERGRVVGIHYTFEDGEHEAKKVP